MPNRKIIDLNNEPGEVFEIPDCTGVFFIHDEKLVPIDQAGRVLDDSEKQNRHKRRIEIMEYLFQMFIIIFVLGMIVFGFILILQEDQNEKDVGEILLSSCVGAIVGYALGITKKSN